MDRLILTIPLANDPGSVVSHTVSEGVCEFMT